MAPRSLFLLYGMDQVAKGVWKTATKLVTSLFVVDEDVNLALAGAAIAAMTFLQAVTGLAAVSKSLASCQNALLVVLCVLGGSVVPRRSALFLVFLALSGIGHDTARVKVAISEETRLPSKRTFDRLTQHANAMETFGSLVGWPLTLVVYTAGGLPFVFRALLVPALVLNVMPARSLLCTSEESVRARRRGGRAGTSQTSSAGGDDDCEDPEEDGKRQEGEQQGEMAKLRGAATSVLRGESSIEDSHLHAATETMQYRMTRRLLVTSMILGVSTGLIESAATLYYLEVAEIRRASIIVAFMVSELMNVVTAYVMTYGHERLQVSFCLQIVAIYFLVPKSTPAAVVLACHVVVQTTNIVNRRATVRLQDVYAPRSVPYRRVVTLAEVGQKCAKIAGSFVGPVAFGLSGTAPFAALFLTAVVGGLWVSDGHNRATNEAIVTAFESFAPRVATTTRRRTTAKSDDDDDDEAKTSEEYLTRTRYDLRKSYSNATLMRNVIGIYGLIQDAEPTQIQWPAVVEDDELTASMHGRLATRAKVIAGLRLQKQALDRALSARLSSSQGGALGHSSSQEGSQRGRLSSSQEGALSASQSSSRVRFSDESSRRGSAVPIVPEEDSSSRHDGTAMREIEIERLSGRSSEESSLL